MMFIAFGIQPTLALAECLSLFPENVHLETASTAGCFFDNSNEEATAILSRLAMSLKIADNISPVFLEKDLEKKLLEILLNTNQERAIFGLSVYNLGNTKTTQNIEGQLSGIGMRLKKALKEKGLSVRVISGKEPRLSSVQVATNHLLDKGCEIVILVTPEGLRLGITKAVQDFKGWSKRDFGRPERDAKSGMLPPKLARFLVNLSGANPKTDTLFDPFCGSGTVLMEASLLGFTRLLGSDISERAVEDTETNLGWLKERHPEISLPDLFVEDAKDLSMDLQNRFHAVVAEVFLGEPRSKKPSQKEAENTVRELTQLYKQVFSRLFLLARPNASFVIAFPAFATREGEAFLPLQKLLTDIGFKVKNIVSDKTPQNLKELSPSGGLLYKRINQFVWRDIMIFQKPE